MGKSHIHFVIFGLIYILKSHAVEGTHYDWTKNPANYTSDGRYLDVTPLQVLNKPIVTQCAMACLRDSRCMSYNFAPETAVCQLNEVTHNDVPGTSFKTNDTFEYYLRETFSIDPAAFGLCSGVTCLNGGKCIETKSASGNDTFLCVCVAGWVGEYCDTAADRPEWAAWNAWNSCSVTCGSGWRSRSRSCTDSVTGQDRDVFECYGRDVDIELCVLQQCPRWNHWGDWSGCSAYTTCGRGYRTRERTCSDGGTPGIDNYCMGPTNQTGPCNEMDCNAPIRLQNGTLFGEGRIEVYNDLTQSWGLICADFWDMAAANIACHQMGFSGASLAVSDGRYGTGSTPLTLSNLSCAGDEWTIQRCVHAGWETGATCSNPGALAAGVQCKVDGDWNIWSTWGDCSVTCANGFRTRTRNCDLPPSLHGGNPCTGDSSEQKPCSLPPCPGSGLWNSWGPWEACDVSCDDGSQRRYRTCAETVVACSGDGEESQSCSTNIPCAGTVTSTPYETTTA